MSDTAAPVGAKGATGRASTGRNINDPGALAEVLGDDFTTVGEATLPNARMRARDVRVFYGDKQAIFDVNLDIASNEVIAMIGPSGCGKSTLLRCLNRMNDTIDGCRVEGPFASTNKIYTTRNSTWFRSGPGWEWCSKNRTRSPSPCTTTWLTVHVFMDWRAPNTNWTKSSKSASKRPACGPRLRTV